MNKHLIFFIYALAGLSGTISAVKFISSYLQTKSVKVKYYLYFLASYSSMIIFSVFSVYYSTNIESHKNANIIAMLGIMLSCHALVFSLPNFIHHAININMLRLWRIIFKTVLLIAPVNGLIFILLLGDKLQNLPIMLSLFLFGTSFVYCAIIFSFNRKKNENHNPLLTRIAYLFLILSICLIIFEMVFLKEFNSIYSYSIAMPIIYLVWNIISFYMKIIPHQNSLKMNLQISPQILSTFKITTQEKKIIKEIVAGKGNKEIASELCISSHTVKNHITNIYKKTGATNRVELLSKLSDK